MSTFTAEMAKSHLTDAKAGLITTKYARILDRLVDLENIKVSYRLNRTHRHKMCVQPGSETWLQIHKL